MTRYATTEILISSLASGNEIRTHSNMGDVFQRDTAEHAILIT